LVHGKDQDDSRFQQLRSTMEHFYSTCNHETSVLFNHYLPGLAAELEALGHHWTSRDLLAKEVWQALQQREVLKRSGSRMSLCRFQSVIGKAESKVGEWHIDLLERTFLCLELDMLGSKKFMDQLDVQLGPAEKLDEGGGTTDPKVTTFEDRAFRNVCKNCVVVSTMALSEMNHLRIVKSVLLSGGIIKEAHARQNKLLRSSTAGVEYFLWMAKGGFLLDVSKTVAKLADQQSLRNADFIMPSAVSPWKGPTQEELNEDALSKVFGMYTLALAGHVLRRGLWIYSWPWRMVLLLDETRAQSTMELFQKDVALWRRFVAMDRAKTKEEQALEKRHLLGTTSCQQYIKAFDANGGLLSEQLLRVVRGRHQGCYVTQAVEEMIGVQKNRKVTKGTKKYRTPARSFASVIASPLLPTRHKYTMVQADMALPRQCAFLDKSAFKACKEGWSMDFAKVQSSSPTPGWHSPSATNWVAPCADLWMYRAVETQQLPWEVVCKAWLGSVLVLKNLVAFNYQSDAAKAGWYLGIQHIDNSCVLSWPLVRSAVPGHSDAIVYELQRDVIDAPLLFIHEITDLEAASLCFRSPLWQWQNLPNARGKMGQMVRLMEVTSPRPLPKLLALHAYFDMRVAALQEMAKYLGMELPPGCSLFEALFTLIQKELGADESRALEIVHRRLAASHPETDVNAVLLRVDEAAELLERSDMQVLHEEQQDVQLQCTARAAFAREYRERRWALAKAKGKAKAKAKAKWLKAPKLDSGIEHATAAAMLPPGASCWRGLTRGVWCGHLPPYVRISHPWGTSETVACLWVVRELWRQHIEWNALDDSACIVEGLMAMDL